MLSITLVPLIRHHKGFPKGTSSTWSKAINMDFIHTNVYSYSGLQDDASATKKGTHDMMGRLFFCF